MNFETGKVSAFSSLNDLRAHLKKNELMREERRRQRELYRQHQLLLKKQQQQGQQEQPLPQQQQQLQLQEDQLPNPLLLSSDPKSNQELHHRRINLIQSPTKADIMLLSSLDVDNNNNNTKVPTHHHILQTIQEPRAGSNREDDIFEETDHKVWSDHDHEHCYDNKALSPRSVYITTTALHNDETSEITPLPGLVYHERNEDGDSSFSSSMSSLTKLSTKKESENDDTYRDLMRDSNKKRKRKKFSITKPIKKALKKVWKKVKPLFVKKEAVNLTRAKGNLC